MCTLIRHLGFIGIFFVLFIFFNTHLYCLVECLSMIVWTCAILGVLCALTTCFLFLYLHLFTAIEHVMFQTEKRSINAPIIITISFFIGFSICLPVCLRLSLSVCLSPSLAVCLSVCLSKRTIVHLRAATPFVYFLLSLSV